ncbi:hypothetical protein E4K67_14890 [Desulfosporosinus fructosivorans]|uniref:Uncharacterized protein n=1 Tax=Desulfosporosinus fructosivorans TaxID=2018669 RepID=A0A4Z0R3K4_9FIRM|nr:hypothetical protein E4K67_14890 [Desulfosporosinus fructosivorans]
MKTTIQGIGRETIDSVTRFARNAWAIVRRILSMSSVILNTGLEAGRVVIMFRKNCRVCGNASYSSNERGSWPCPYCNTDLIEERAMGADTSEPIRDEDQALKIMPLQSESHRGES